jgi:hypothetical protein
LLRAESQIFLLKYLFFAQFAAASILLPDAAAPLPKCGPAGVYCCYLLHFAFSSSVTRELCVGDVEDSCKKGKTGAFRYCARVTSFAMLYELRCSPAPSSKEGKGHARTGHEGPEGDKMHSFTLPSTSALDGGVGGQRHAPAALPPENTWYA